MCVTNIQKTTPGVRESVEECLSGSVPPELSCEKALHLGYIEQSRASGTMRRVRLTVRHFSANGISLYPGEDNPSVLLVHDDAASCSFIKSLVASPPRRAFSPCWLRSQLHMVNMKSLLAG